MWTIYKHPADYPNDIVARLWLIKDGKQIATDEIETFRIEYDCIEWGNNNGLHFIPRAPSDDPVILGTWI